MGAKKIVRKNLNETIWFHLIHFFFSMFAITLQLHSWIFNLLWIEKFKNWIGHYFETEFILFSMKTSSRSKFIFQSALLVHSSKIQRPNRETHISISLHIIILISQWETFMKNHFNFARHQWNSQFSYCRPKIIILRWNWAKEKVKLERLLFKLNDEKATSDLIKTRYNNTATKWLQKLKRM